MMNETDGTAAGDADDVGEPAYTRERLARQWAHLLTGLSFLPMPLAAVTDLLAGVLDRLLPPSGARPSAEDCAAAGTLLVEANATGPDSLRCSVELLGAALPRLPELRHAPDAAARTIAALGALSGGYADALRLRVLDEQESVRQAVVAAKNRVESQLRASEARFREVFSQAAVGIVVSDPKCDSVEINRAMAELLGEKTLRRGPHRPQDVFAPADVDFLRGTSRALITSGRARGRGKHTLVRRDGEAAYVAVTTSVLCDAEGAPTHVVTFVEDQSDMLALQDRLTHQTLHDPVTRMSNRQHLVQRLDDLLLHGRTAPSMTLMWMRLDGLEVVVDTFGQQAGDELLRRALMVLNLTLPDDPLIFARVGSVDFAMLLEHRDGPRHIGEIIERCNVELAEPVYLTDTDTDTQGAGFAVSVSVGAASVVTGSESDLGERKDRRDELLRRARAALRRARLAGGRQWASYDPRLDEWARERMTAAARIPGAWETGDIAVVYQPIYRMADGEPVAAQALLSWNHPVVGPVHHRRLVSLAEKTGYSVSLGREVLAQICTDAARWRERAAAVGRPLPNVSLALGEHQALDPDLVRVVLRALRGADLPPQALEVIMPAAAFRSADGIFPEMVDTAEDNLRTLREMGVGVSMSDNAGGFSALRYSRTLPLSLVTIGRQLTEVSLNANPAADQVVRRLAALIEASGLEMTAVGLDTAAQVEWWRAAGAARARGLAFSRSMPTEAIDDLFDRPEPDRS
jgi:diguanylate cyclase (GGDEF)-like protein/PAS domain S-box-containing protein